MINDSPTGRFLEIEVTPEMVAAGEDCVYQHHIIDGGASRTEIQDCAREIFITMMALAPSKSPTPSH